METGSELVQIDLRLNAENIKISSSTHVVRLVSL